MNRAGFSSATRCNLEAENLPVVLIARYFSPLHWRSAELDSGPRDEAVTLEEEDVAADLEVSIACKPPNRDHKQPWSLQP